jgi:hypothetical protein
MAPWIFGACIAALIVVAVMIGLVRDDPRHFNQLLTPIVEGFGLTYLGSKAPRLFSNGPFPKFERRKMWFHFDRIVDVADKDGKAHHVWARSVFLGDRLEYVHWYPELTSIVPSLPPTSIGRAALSSGAIDFVLRPIVEGHGFTYFGSRASREDQKSMLFELPPSLPSPFPEPALAKKGSYFDRIVQICTQDGKVPTVWARVWFDGDRLECVEWYPQLSWIASEG